MDVLARFFLGCCWQSLSLILPGSGLSGLNYGLEIAAERWVGVVNISTLTTRRWAVGVTFCSLNPGSISENIHFYYPAVGCRLKQ